MMGAGGAGGVSYHLEWSGGGPVTLYGKAPEGATEVALTRADGTVATAPVTADGWWLAVLPASTDPASLERLEARSASGSVVASTTLRTPDPPDAITG
jgi:hypothetical protein